MGKKLGVFYWPLLFHQRCRLHAEWRRANWWQLILHPSQWHAKRVALWRSSVRKRAARRLSLLVALEILEMRVFRPFNFVRCAAFWVERVELIKVACQICHISLCQVEHELLVHLWRFMSWARLTLRYLCRSHRFNRIFFKALTDFCDFVIKLVDIDGIIPDLHRLGYVRRLNLLITSA